MMSRCVVSSDDGQFDHRGNMCKQKANDSSD